MGEYLIYPKQYNNNNYKLHSDTCFVVMPFSEDLNNTYMVIESVANSNKIKCTRADNISTASEPILSKICTQISQSYFIIVDITNLSPNVFYELGIAHVLREANKVLIIKEEQTLCPSDIKHLHYYQYKKNNLVQLKETIGRFFTENNILHDLYSALRFRDLISNDTMTSHEFVSSLSVCISSVIDTLILILNNKTSQLERNNVLILLSGLTETLNKLHKTDKLWILYFDLTLFVISKTYRNVDISNYITSIFAETYKNLSNEWMASYCLIILESEDYFETAIKWILSYLKNVSPAAFDLAKYQIEIGIIRSNSSKIDYVLTRELESDNKTLAEHCAKLIKERRTFFAIPVLLKIVRSEKNPYVVRSCLDALVYMAPKDILLEAKAILENRKEYIKANPFINNHIIDLNKRILELQNGCILNSV